MAKIKYRCKNENCKNEFTGDAYALKCPKCSCPDPERVDPPGGRLKVLIDKLKTDRKTQIIAAIILLIIIVLLTRTCSKNTDNSVYKFDCNLLAEGDGVEVNIFRIKENNKLEKIDNPDRYLYITDSDGNTLQFHDIDKNKIYVCKAGLVNLKWRNQKFILKNPKDTLRQIIVPLSEGKPNSKAICPTELKITSAVPDNDNCQMIVTTSLDKEKGRPVMISIHGRGGPYLKSNIQDAKGITKVDVWAYEEKVDTNLKNPIPFYERNGIPCIMLCKVCKKEDLQKLKEDFILAANNYGNKPDDRGFLKAFKNLIPSNDLKIKLDGKFVKGGLSQIENEFKINYNNNNTRYKIDENSIVLNKKACMIIQFEFITKK